MVKIIRIQINNPLIAGINIDVPDSPANNTLHTILPNAILITTISPIQTFRILINEYSFIKYDICDIK